MITLQYLWQRDITNCPKVIDFQVVSRNRTWWYWYWYHWSGSTQHESLRFCSRSTIPFAVTKHSWPLSIPFLQTPFETIFQRVFFCMAISLDSQEPTCAHCDKKTRTQSPGGVVCDTKKLLFQQCECSIMLLLILLTSNTWGRRPSPTSSFTITQLVLEETVLLLIPAVSFVAPAITTDMKQNWNLRVKGHLLVVVLVVVL